MSYPLESSGPLRRTMETRTSGYGYGRSRAAPSNGFRSQSWSRGGPGVSSLTASHKRSVHAPVPRAYGSSTFSCADGADLSHSGALLSVNNKRSNEKEQLQGLNDRFAVYIDRVHYLEQQNQQVEAEIRELRQQQPSRTHLDDHYARELQELRGALERIHHEKAQIQLDCDHVEDDIQRLHERVEEEVRVREEAEAIIRALKKDTSDSELAKSELEKKVQSLQDEVAFIRNNHEEEVGELIEQIQASQVSVEMRDAHGADLTEALREIRQELEGHSSQSLQQVESWYMCRYAKLTEAAEQNKDAIKSARDEIADYRRQLQSKTVELESVRGTRDSLERQLNDIEDRHNNDLASLQETIHQLDNELKSTKWEMARHLREYQDLLNVKMALDIEIAAYRKLLESEETHFSAFPDRQALFSARTSKSKSDGPKLKVQHKFVEEIIEETRTENDQADMDEALADIAQEMSVEEGGEEEEDEEGGEEEEVVAAKAKVSASEPSKEEDEGEGDGDKEEEKGEDDGEGEGDKEEDAEGGDEDGEDGDEGEEEVEETALCSKPGETGASLGEEEEEKDEDQGSDKGGKSDEEEDKGQKKGKGGKSDDEEKESQAKSKPSKAEAGKPETAKEKKGESKSPSQKSESSSSPKTGKPDSPKDEKTSDKSDSKGGKKDAAMNGDLDKSSPDEGKDADVIANGVDESPVKEEKKTVTSKTVETITTGGSGSQQVTKSVTVTETAKEAELQEKLVKKTEKQSTQSTKQEVTGGK